MNETSKLAHCRNASTCAPLIERLLQFAETDSLRDAVVTPTSTLSYVELLQQVRETAQLLRKAGISEASVIGIQCTDELQHFLLCLASIHVGATSFAIPTHESSQVRKSLISQCCATHVADGNGISRTNVDSGSRSIPPNDARLLFATSGTTGSPKLVVHHDSDLVAQAHRHIASQNERFACLASMEHNFAKRHRLYCLATGATNVFLDANPGSLVSQCLALQVNVLHVSAFQAQELLAVPDIGSLSNIRLKLGGSHVPLVLRRQLREQITPCLQAGYGTTETGAIGFTDPGDGGSAESVGQPLEGIEARVVGPDREALGDGERGELVIRCDGMFRGYFGNPELTATRLVDGWFYTGDIGYLDSSRRIHLCGRSDDMFVFNSMNIYPQDIESRICQFPGVQESVVLPKRSAVHGNIPVAFVVFSGDTKPDLAALQAYVREHVGARCPRQFTSVEVLPRNASGKVSRRDALDLPERSHRIRSLIIEALSADAKKRLKTSAIAAFEKGDADIKLGGTGLDSFARMEMLVALEIEYGVVITPEEFGRFDTFGDICSRVLASQPEGASKPSTHFPAIDTAPFTAAQLKTLRFFQRVFHHCPTVAQLNKAFGTLEHRLTPSDVLFLSEQHGNDRLIPADVAPKFHAAASTWLQKMNRLMQGSGKQQPEPFVARRIGPSVIYFAGPGIPANKRLLICFAPKAGRMLTIPNAVLMQHTDSTHYDLLVVSDSARESYRTGIPLLGRNINEIIEWIGNLELINEYRAIRTIGCSAGAFLAVIAGCRLDAELALSVAGRFHAERYPHRIVGRVFATWQTFRKANFSRVLMSYPADKGKSRDRIYARIIANLTGGSMLGLEFADGIAGHHFLQPLAERGELVHFLDRTIFARLDDEVVREGQANMILSLPAGEIRHVG